MNQIELQQKIPSGFASDKHGATSSKYSFLPTTEIIRAFEDIGWKPSWAGERKCRKEDRKGFQKHMIRFRNPDMGGDEFPEILLTNSHDRSSSMQLHAGIFRFVCSNGMVVADSTMERIRIRHMDVSIDRIIHESKLLAGRLPELMGTVQRWKSREMNPVERIELARAALDIRYGADSQNGKSWPIFPERLLGTRRIADIGNDLWKVFNVLQENITRGGVALDYRKKSRAVNSIDSSLRINKQLWEAAGSFMKN